MASELLQAVYYSFWLADRDTYGSRKIKCLYINLRKGKKHTHTKKPTKKEKEENNSFYLYPINTC